MRRNIRRRKRRTRTAITDISLTPLIDTALTLLIIFMVAAPMMQNAISITLPKGKKNEVGSTPQELVVYVDKAGKHYLDGKPYESKKLIEQLQRQVGRGKERTVFVKADQGASYGNVLELVDQIKVVGGVKYVALATQKRSQAA